MQIRYTNHAELKIILMNSEGFSVSKKDVERALLRPSSKNQDDEPNKYVAYTFLDNKHLLGVVYRDENGDILVITIYPHRL